MKRWIVLIVCAAAASLACVLPTRAQTADANDLVLSGVMTHADHRDYRELRFIVPEGARALHIDLTYERGEPWAAIDMALYDPQRFRGASGFAKTRIFIGESIATPSYLAGPLPAGEWRLVLGGANAPEGRTTPYNVRVRFERAENTALAPFERIVRDEPGWYRGDFHTHSGHSDGVCATSSGGRAPCPLYRTLDAAAARGLDFIAVTDHNTVSHLNELAALQLSFDQLAVIPAQEITTYHGHMNAFGAAAPVDFRLDQNYTPRVSDIVDAVERQGGLVSINHPGISLTQGCPGCGWSADLSPNTQIDAIEVVNGVIARWGDGAEGPASSIPFWIAQLSAGRHVTAIGGSDNHDPAISASEYASIGGPTTVVYAQNLSSAAILDGVRAGHVFIDMQGRAERRLIVRAQAGANSALMGDTLTARRGVTMAFTIEAAGLPEGARIEIWRDGEVWNTDTRGTAQQRGFNWRADGRRHWFNAVLRDSAGQLLLLTNPIYVSAGASD